MSPRVAIAVEVEQGDLPLSVKDLESSVTRVLDDVAFEGSLSVAVVTDDGMRVLNRDYHQCDEPTDVLAFPLDGGENSFAAEVIVSLDTARREAERRGVEPASELLLYLVHGILHLVGEDDHDPEDAQRMHARTVRILESLGHANTIEVSTGKPGTES